MSKKFINSLACGLIMTAILMTGCGNTAGKDMRQDNPTEQGGRPSQMVQQTQQVQTEENPLQNTGVWEVTSYVDESGNQGLFYTLYNEETDKLIVIDGGWTENTEKVRTVLGRFGNHVDAWFITHYHNDHIGAVNEIFAEPEGIEIDKIYTSPIDMDRYLAESYEWDMPEYYQRFAELTADMPNIHACDRGDTFEFDGLSVKVLSTYDSIVAEASLKDIPNNGCLVLKFTTANKSMIFMSDAHNNEIMDILESNCGEELKCDYLQLGHHGNNTIDYDYYDLFAPSEVIFDAPEWLMTGENYKAAPLLAYFQDKGINCYDYRTGDNALILD